MFTPATPEAKAAKAERVKQIAREWRQRNVPRIAHYQQTRRVELSRNPQKAIRA